jgi:hypothetical protein
MASLFSTGDILFVVTVSSSQRMLLRSSCQQLTFQTCFTAETAGRFRLHRFSQACVEPSGGGEHEFTAIAMRACASCGRDEIETVYCLRVVIETPRIELAISVATLALLKSALASHARSARFPDSTIYDVDCCSVRVNADRTSDRLRTPSNFLRSLYSLFGLSVAEKAVNTAACDRPRKRT